MDQKKQEQMQEITDRLEQGLQELFESEQYKEYLKVMSKFHNYSFNNSLLIAMQKPDATLIAGFSAWKNKFDRHVKKGEKGIQIISPVITKEKDEKTGDLIERVVSFRPAYVFDVSQTEGKEIPNIAVDTLKGNIEQYNTFFTALERISPFPINFEEIERGVHGYCHFGEKRIAINEGMSELQTLKTMIHEIAHAKLHDKEKGKQVEKLNRFTKEVQAESVAYAVCQYYGFDTSDYSFGYIAGWSNGRNLSELRASLVTIRNTANEIINGVDKHFIEIRQEIEKMREAAHAVGLPFSEKLEQKQNEITLILADEKEHTYTYPFDVISVDIDELGGDRTAVFKAAEVNLDAAVSEFYNCFHGLDLEKEIAEEYGVEWVESISYEDGTIIKPGTEEIQRERTEEESLLFGKVNRFGIYQLKENEELHDFKFENLDSLKSRGLQVEKKNYDLIYTDLLSEGQTLDEIHEQFNLFRPEDFTGHSLSVSDIILFHKDEISTAYYVDSFGFKEIPDFFLKEQEKERTNFSPSNPLKDCMKRSAAKAPAKDVEDHEIGR